MAILSPKNVRFGFRVPDLDQACVFVILRSNLYGFWRFYHGINVGAVMVHPGPLPRGAVCHSYTQFNRFDTTIKF